MEKDLKKPKNITKIALTGGPCAGKTTAISKIAEAFLTKDYKVLFVPETATEVITGGITSQNCGNMANFEKVILKLQLEKEAVFEMAAQMMEEENILIVCDRGALDCRAYMEEEDFRECLEFLGKNEIELRDGYDAVFHLVTAAKGAEEVYTTANNAARTETIPEAIVADDRLISAWTGHPHLRIIDNSTDFETKIKRLIAEIFAVLGEPEPYEIERKFLIEYPDISWLENDPNCQRVEIIQTYLKSDNGDEVRVRQRGCDGNYIYFETVKRAVSGIKRIETERRLSEKEYLELLMEADTTRRQIRKTRYCLTYEGQYFEIDVYPFWNDKAIAEIELASEEQEVKFPEKIHVIKEVTDDPAYRNASLALI